jgi:uncharacterized protein
MSEENVEILRRAFDAFNRGDIDAAVADFAPECEYFASGALPDSAPFYRGPEGYKRNISWILDEFDDAHVEVHELIGAGDQVMASLIMRGRGKRSGVETSWNLWQVWTVREGKAVRGRGFTERSEALKAAGLSE